MPERACPFRCLYCNQQVITGSSQRLEAEAVRATIERYLATQPAGREVKLGFFGGTFTGLPLDEQERLLRVVSPYVESGHIHSVSLSTRPDYIDSERVALLRRYHVRNVELGVQSLDDEVLAATRRGYTAAQVLAAAATIQAAGLEVGMQMMIGLPSDTKARTIRTAEQIVAAGATNTQIYPTLVVKDTALEALWLRGDYRPLTLEEAVDWTKALVPIFERGGVTVLRVGLHPTEGFIGGSDYLAGPFHVSFRELVESALLRERLEAATASVDAESVAIHTSPEAMAAAVGYEGSNRQWLEARYRHVRFVADTQLEGREVRVEPDTENKSV